MVKLRLKVGPKGQIIIPKPLRDAYNIVEGKTILIEPLEEGILIRKALSKDEFLELIKKRRRNLKGVRGKLGELSRIDLEWEFEE